MPLPNPWNHALHRMNVTVCELSLSKPDAEAWPCQEAASHSCRLRVALQEKRLYLSNFQTAQGSQGSTEHAPDRTGLRHGPERSVCSWMGSWARKCQRQYWNAGPSAPKCCSYPLKASSTLPRGRCPAGERYEFHSERAPAQESGRLRDQRCPQLLEMGVWAQ